MSCRAFTADGQCDGGDDDDDGEDGDDRGDGEGKKRHRVAEGDAGRNPTEGFGTRAALARKGGDCRKHSTHDMRLFQYLRRSPFYSDVRTSDSVRRAIETFGLGMKELAPLTG